MDQNDFIRTDSPPAPGTVGREAIGGNNPPPELRMPETLQATLAEDYATLTQRKADLLAAFERMPAIEDDEADRKATDFMAMVTTAWDAANVAHKKEKEPYLSGGRIVDGFFNQIRDPLAALKAKVNAKVTAYKVEKARQEQAARDEAARLARQEEERKRLEADKLAEKAKTDAGLNKAIVAEQVAGQATENRVIAEQQTQFKAADVTRVHSDMGGTSSLKFKWDFKIADMNSIPRQFLMVNEAAIRAHISGRPSKNDAPAPVAGIEFFKNYTTTFRK